MWFNDACDAALVPTREVGLGNSCRVRSEQASLSPKTLETVALVCQKSRQDFKGLRARVGGIHTTLVTLPVARIYLDNGGFDEGLLPPSARLQEGVVFYHPWRRNKRWGALKRELSSLSQVVSGRPRRSDVTVYICVAVRQANSVLAIQVLDGQSHVQGTHNMLTSICPPHQRLSCLRPA